MDSLQKYYSIIDNSDFKKLSENDVIELLPKLKSGDTNFLKVELEKKSFFYWKIFQI